METAEFTTSTGTIRIAVRVIADIANKAVLAVPGVAGIEVGLSDAITQAINMERTGGVNVSINEKGVSINLYILVKHGIRVPDLALTVQGRVKEAVQNQTNVIAEAVNVHIQGIVFDTMKVGDLHVAELTYKGIQRFVSGISQAFGKTFHKGVWLHREESKLVADISIAVKPNVDVYQTALHIQEKVKTIVLQNMHVSVCDVNVIITGITE